MKTTRKETKKRIVELLSDGLHQNQVSKRLTEEGMAPSSERSVIKMIREIKKERNSKTLFQLGAQVQNEKWAFKAGEMVQLAEQEGRNEGYFEGHRDGLKSSTSNSLTKGRIQGFSAVIVISIVIFIFLWSMGAIAQTEKRDFVYLSGSFDPNQAFGIIDNPRTKTESFGFDYDLEVGARFNHFGVYAFGGSFQEINYINYGAGGDYYVNWFSENGIDMSVGLNTGFVMRKDGNGNWGAFMAQAVRAVTTIWIFENVGINGRVQYQTRPDIEVHGILEGSLGVIFKMDNKPLRR